MPRLTEDQWATVRAEYEAGSANQSTLSKRHGVSRTAIQKRIEAEGWIQDLEPAIRRKVAEKVAGVAAKVAARNPEKTEQAIDEEAERRANVERRHRDEMGVVRERLQAALTAARAATNADERRAAFDIFKQAKISAETLTLVHADERKTWKLDNPLAPGANIESEVEW